MKSESYSFSITPLEKPNSIDPFELMNLGTTFENLRSLKSRKYNTLIDSIPSDFPDVTVDTINNPSPGNIFLTTFGNNDTKEIL